MIQASVAEIDQVLGADREHERPPTMGNLAKLSYSHQALIDLIVAHPEYTQARLAQIFGYTPAWICNILASDVFQVKLAERRAEVVDPTLVASLEEKFRGLAHQSLAVLQRKLEEPAVKAEVALRAAELSSKALGMGGHAPPTPAPIDLNALASRLELLRSPRLIEGEVLKKESSDG